MDNYVSISVWDRSESDIPFLYRYSILRMICIVERKIDLTRFNETIFLLQIKPEKDSTSL